MARRLKGMGQERYRNGFEPTMHPDALDEPKKVKDPSMFFVCSMSDLFHSFVPSSFIDQVMNTIVETPQHTYQLLTKRTENMVNYFVKSGIVPSNAWVGTTVENSDAKKRIEQLKELKKLCNAPVTFLSCEPLLSDLGELDLKGIDWVIVGGESGNRARPMCKDWVLNIKRQCNAQDVPFFFKQWGAWGEDGIKRSAKANGCTIDGEVFHAWPRTGMRIVEEGDEMNNELRIETERLIRDTERFCREEAESIDVRVRQLNDFTNEHHKELTRGTRGALLVQLSRLIDASDALKEVEREAKNFKMEGGKQ